jgi:kynurenine formamidase
LPLIDLTAELSHGMVRHPAPHLPPVEVVPVATHAETRRLVQRVTFGTHVSTHIDAPLHAIEGAASIDQIPLETFCGPALKLRLAGVGLDAPIDSAQLEPHAGRLAGERRVVLETGWARQTWGSAEYFTQGPFLTRAASQLLADSNLALLGMDFPNVDCHAETRPGISAPNHQILLGKGMVLLENLLHLDEIAGEHFRLTALPLKLVGGDGCPCRAIAEVDA